MTGNEEDCHEAMLDEAGSVEMDREDSESRTLDNFTRLRDIYSHSVHLEAQEEHNQSGEMAELGFVPTCQVTVSSGPVRTKIASTRYGHFQDTYNHLKRLWRMYAEMLACLPLVVALTVGIYAALSYYMPHVVCQRVLEQSKVSRLLL